jgi:Zn-dependent protease with chaperone function
VNEFQTPNIYEQQRRNKNRTILIMLLFVLFFVFLGYGFDLYYFGNDLLGLAGESYGFPIATFIALLFGTIFTLYSYQSGAKAVLSSAGAYPAPLDDPISDLAQRC